MTIKPPRTHFDKERDEERIRFLRRAQQEQEAKKSLRDYLIHSEEDDEHGESDNPSANKIS